MEGRLKDDLNLFEFGSGYSTYFYAKKVLAVTSVEYDEDWFQIIKSDMPENVNLIYKEKDTLGLIYTNVDGSINTEDICMSPLFRFDVVDLEVENIVNSNELNIKYILPSSNEISIRIVDLQGSMVELRNEFLEAGSYNEVINTKNFNLPIGQYFVVLSSNGYIISKRFLVVE